MPIYEFECEKGHRLEKIFSINTCPDRVVCDFIINFVEGNITQQKCGLLAEKAWSLPIYPSHGKPTIVFKNKKTGETEVALYEGQKAPKGFIKEELKTPQERSKFEKEETQKQRIEDEYKTEERRFAVDYTRKQRHDDLKAKMSSITSKADNPTVAEDLLKKTMERTRNKKVPAKRSEMRLDVNHMNKTNIDKG